MTAYPHNVLVSAGIDVQGLDRVDSIADPWEMLISSIWAYKCNVNTVCLTADSGLESDITEASRPSPLQYEQVLRLSFYVVFVV